jgi:hypothetical protein
MKATITETQSPEETSIPRIVITRHSINVVRGLYTELNLTARSF